MISLFRNSRSLQRAEPGMNYYVRGTFTRNNLDFSQRCDPFRRSWISTDVHRAGCGCSRKSHIPSGRGSSDRSWKSTISWRLRYIKRKKEGRALISSTLCWILQQGPCVAKSLSGCGSGTEYLAVTPWGDLYPCHQFVGQENFLLGNVDKALPIPRYAMSSSSATSTPKKSAETALQDSMQRRMCGKLLQLPWFHYGRL